MRCSLESISCWIRYLVSAISLAPAASIVNRLFGFTEPIRSRFEPVLRNFGEKPAKGPNSRAFLLLI
ncbi:hypothetical protein D3C76_1871490 [compost metagenome]